MKDQIRNLWTKRRFLPFGAYALFNILLVIVPLTVVILLFFSSMRAQMLGEVLAMRASVQQSVNQNIDQALSNFGSMVAYASLDPDLRPYQLRKNNYDTITALRHLKLHASTQGDMLVYFYIHSDDSFYSATGRLSLRTFETMYRFDGGWAQDDLMALLNSPFPYATSPSGCSLVQRDAQGAAYIAIVYPWKYGSALYGTALGLMPISWLEQQMPKESAEFSYVLDGEGHILLGGQREFDRELVALTLASEGGPVNMGSEQYHPVWLRSRLNGWRYLTMVPASHVRSLLLGEHWHVFVAILALMVALSIAGVLLALRYYLPVQGLSEMVRGVEEAAPGDASHLHERVSTILARSEYMRSALDEKREYIRQSFFSQLLRGGLTAEECTEALRNVDVQMHGPTYAVLVIDIGPVTLRERNAVFTLLSGALRNVAEALYKDYLVAFYSGTGGDQFADGLAEEIRVALGAMPGMLCRIGVGQPCASLDRMDRSFVEAVAALESSGAERVVYFDTMVARNLSGPDHSLAQARVRLSESIRQGAAAGVQQGVSELAQLLLDMEAHLGRDRMAFAMSGILHTLLPVLEEAELPNLGWEIHMLAREGRVDSFVQKLMPLCSSAADVFAQRRESWMSLRISDALAYIDAHFAEHDISLNAIAERFNMTNSSLSRLFSENTGMRFIDYLSKKRMERAAELLLHTDMGIGEIVEQVGYIDASSFTRKFTKAYHVSPTAYRKGNKCADQVD